MRGRVTTKHTINITTTHSKINGLWATWLRSPLTQEKEALSPKMICIIQPLYLLLLKLQLTICYVPCVEPEFRSLAQYDVTL